MTSMPPHVPRDFVGKYQLGDQIGKGNFGVVFKCETEQGEAYAAKIIQKTADEKRETMVRNEVAFLRELRDCEHVINLVDYYEDEICYCLVMELMQHGDVMDAIVQKKKLSEKEAQRIVYALAKALDKLHAMNIVHRDIKPENLLLSARDGGVKLADFGLAIRASGGTSINGFCGTPYYIAPEVCREKPYGKSVDAWSVGAVLYNIISGWPPFYSENTMELLEMIKKGNVNFKSGVWKSISMECKDCIQKLLATNPYARMSIAQLLQHPFLKKAASKDHLMDGLKELTAFNARRKFRAAARAVVATGKLRNVLKALKMSNNNQDMVGDGPSPRLIIGERQRPISCQVSPLKGTTALTSLRKILTERPDEVLKPAEATEIMNQLGFDPSEFDSVQNLLEEESIPLTKRELVCALGLLLGGRGEETLKFCFDILDQNANGTLNKDELATLFQFFEYEDENLNINIAGEHLLARLFEKMETTSNAEISYQQFHEAMLSEPLLARVWGGKIKRRSSVSMASQSSSISSESPRSQLLIHNAFSALDKQLVETELISLTNDLLLAIQQGNWQVYEKLCSPDLTAFEPEARGQLVNGLEFHKFYFELAHKSNSPVSVQTTMINPKVTLLGNGHCAYITYVRLMQSCASASSPPVTNAYNETRIWERKDNADWCCVHFHRSTY